MTATVRSLLALWLPAVLLIGACSPHDPAAGPTTTTATPTPAAPTSTSSPATTIRQWEARAGGHFRESAAALEQVSEASLAEDEFGLWSGCRRLHDANSIGLQYDLPAPDPGLTAELQRMIDDMNTATHACLRFVLARSPADAANYRDYLTRAVEHLRQAKLILNSLLK